MKTGSSLRKEAKILPRRASRLAGRTQSPLDDVLVRAPIPQPDDRRAQEHAGPGIVTVEIPRDPCGFLHWHPCSFHAGRDNGLPEIEHFGTEGRPQFGPATQPMDAKDCQQRGAENQNDCLQRFGIGDGSHPTQRGIQARENHHQDGSNPEAVERCRADSHLHFRQQGAEHHAARKNAYGDLGKYVGDQGD